MMLHRYKRYTIVVFAGHENSTGNYMPGAVILWTDNDGKKVDRSLTFRSPCLTSLYAMAVALDEAKGWIDQRLDEPG
jgi:hypothetical protein